MSVVNPWSKFYQSSFMEYARDEELPLWLRVYYLACANHRRNGHAPFPPGELAKWFNKPSNQITNAIKDAKKKNHLAPTSNARCLVLFAHKVGGGTKGKDGEPCGLHGRSHAQGVEIIANHTPSM